MEERIPSPSPGEGKDSPRLTTTTISASTALVFRSGTYLVQLPKDQIYRVPPPENAIIADSLRNPTYKRKCSFLQWIFICIIIFGIALATCSVVFSVALKPKNPVFRIEHFLAKNSSQSLLPNMTEYDISLISENPNGVWGIDYKEGGNATLSYTQQEIAAGKPRAFLQGSKGTTVLQLVLNGSQRSMQDSGSGRSVSLVLSVNLTGGVKFGLLQVWSISMLVSCNMKVNTGVILSQGCQVKV